MKYAILVESSSDVIMRIASNCYFEVVTLLQRLKRIVAREKDAVLRADARGDMRWIVNDVFADLKRRNQLLNVRLLAIVIGAEGFHYLGLPRFGKRAVQVLRIRIIQPKF